MKRKIYKHIVLSPNNHRLVHFRGNDFYMLKYDPNMEVGDIVYIAEVDGYGDTIRMYTEKIVEIEPSNDASKMVIKMKHWNECEDIFRRLQQLDDTDDEEQVKHVEFISSRAGMRARKRA